MPSARDVLSVIKKVASRSAGLSNEDRGRFHAIICELVGEIGGEDYWVTQTRGDACVELAEMAQEERRLQNIAVLQIATSFILSLELHARETPKSLASRAARIAIRI